jgi:hypothetical protein
MQDLLYSRHRRHLQMIERFNQQWDAQYRGTEPAVRSQTSWFDPQFCKAAHILAKRAVAASSKSSGVQYYVHWQGLTRDGATWETAEALTADPQNNTMVQRFELSMQEHQKQAIGGSAGPAAAPPAGNFPQASRAARGRNEDFEEEDEDASEREGSDDDEDLLGEPKTIGESTILLPLPMGKALPSGGVVSDDNLLKMAVGHSLASSGVSLQELAELAGCPASTLHSWIFGRGRIDDHTEAELKVWLQNHAAPAWRQRMPDVLGSVANLRDKHTRKRLAHARA